MNRKVQEVALVGAGVVLFTIAGCTGRPKGVSVELANADNPIFMPDANNKDSLVITITKDNTLFIGADPITSDALLISA